MKDNQKNAYEEKMDARLEKWEAQKDLLKARAKEAKADTKAELGKELQELENRSNAAKQKLREIRESGEDAWEELKEGLENSWHSLEKGLENAKAKFKQ